MTYRRFDLASTDAQTALTLYETAFMMALNSEDQDPDSNWARTYGLEHFTSALRTRWPISLDAAGYKKFSGDPHYRSLSHATIELISELWQDGVAMLARVIEAPEFVGWGTSPEVMAMARRVKPNELVADLLAAGESGTIWDGSAFFSNAHPINPKKTSLGTYDNLHSATPVGDAAIQFYRNYFRTQKNASGKNMGLRFTHILTPPALVESWLDILERDFVLLDSASKDASAAVSNRNKGAVQLIVADELTEDDYYYPLAMNKPGMDPWVVVEGPSEEIQLGKTSALYEQHKKVAFESTIELGAGLQMPQGICRVKTT